MHKMSNNNSNDVKYSAMSAITTADTSTLTADRIEWSRSTILSFIEDYRQKRVLWDPNTKGYHIKQTKYEALKILGQKYGTEIRSIRSKIKSLRSSFHREHGKVLNGRRKGVHYQPMWFAYEAIRFILDGEPIRAQQQCNGDMADGESGAEEKVEEKYTKFVEKVNQTEEQHVNGKLHAAGANPSADNACKKEATEDSYGQNVSKLTISANAVAAVPAIRTIPAVTQTLCCLKTTTTTPTVVTLMPMTAIPTTATTATTRTYAYADDNNFAARVAGIGVGVGGIVGRNNVTTTTTAIATATATNEEFASARSDNDSDLQTYCNISAEDVKTEIIEGDITDLSMCERQRSSTPPSSFNFYKQAESAVLNKKRNSHVLLDRYNEDGPGPSKQQKMHEHSNLQANQCDTSNDVSYANKTTTTGTTTPNDEYGVFGEYVAITIRKLKTSKAKIVVKHLINNLLYEAELGKYDQGIPSTREPPQLYKM